MSRRHVLHLAARYHLPSWQGGDVDYPVCRSTQFGAPPRAVYACYDLVDDPAAVDCAACRRSRLFPLLIEHRSAA